MKRRTFLQAAAGAVALACVPKSIPAVPQAKLEFPQPPRFSAQYWFVNVRVSLVTLSPGHCPKNHKLRLNRARRWRRFQEEKASVALGMIESVTGFPAYVMGEPTSVWDSRPLEIQSYALNEEAVKVAGELVCAPGYFVACPVVRTGRYPETI
jgi:hypothetical protein